MIEQKVEAYIERWGGGISRGGNETANLQMFLTELCTLLDLPQPEPARTDRNVNAYTFERSCTSVLERTERQHFAWGFCPSKAHGS